MVSPSAEGSACCRLLGGYVFEIPAAVYSGLFLDRRLDPNLTLPQSPHTTLRMCLIIKLFITLTSCIASCYSIFVVKVFIYDVEKLNASPFSFTLICLFAGGQQSPPCNFAGLRIIARNRRVLGSIFRRLLLQFRYRLPLCLFLSQALQSNYVAR